jgi:hypothetical protein
MPLLVMRAALFLLLVAISFPGFSQKCLVESTSPDRLSRFETWMINQRSTTSSFREQAADYRVPVVFHIIHFGEEFGTASNIPDQRILDQLEILNQDYGRSNSDTIDTPEIFLPVAANTGIEFVLAKRDPEGLPTTGIIRKTGARASYGREQFDELILESFWNPEEYVNIYVTELSGNSIGWSSFPFSDLPGIEEITVNPQKDAVIIDHRFIGNNDNTGANFESLGRTLTHELGHYFGLRHVWGDLLSCEGSDYCEDTPNQSVTYLGQCPESPGVTCDTEDMYSNYMNYTNDACMNLFSSCQAARMRIVLENSPRRKNLINSPALSEAIQVTNDLGIRRILESNFTACGSDSQPVIEVRNYGTNTISQYRIQMLNESVVLQEVTVNSSLEPLEMELVNFSEVQVSEMESSELTFAVVSVNGDVDGNDENDIHELVLPSFNTQVVPYTLDFESGEYSTYSSEGSFSGWQVGQAPNSQVSNVAGIIDFSDELTLGSSHYLVSPILDINGFNAVEVTFSYAYVGDNNSWSKDGLIVALSNDCGETYPETSIIFDGFNSDIQTFNSGNSTSGSLDWNTRTFTITNQLQNELIRIAFIGVNGGNGKLFLDDITIKPGNLVSLDVGIKSIKGLPVVTCNEDILASIEVGNFGFDTLKTYDINYQIEDQVTIISHPNTSLSSGEDTEIQFNITGLSEGVNSISFQTSDPNGLQDENTENNNDVLNIALNSNTHGLPTLVDFQTEDQWIRINPEGEHLFETYNMEGNEVLLINGFEAEESHTENWLVSPILLTAEVENLSMSFEYAHKGRPGIEDNLKVIVSNGCETIIDEIIFDQFSSDLNDEFTDEAFFPDVDDWREVFLDLSEYASNPQIRVSFVYSTANGNNLFLDDIIFYNYNDPEIFRGENLLTVYPNPVTDANFRAVLNLKNQVPIQITLLEMTGRIVDQRSLQYGLNQVLDYEFPELQGVYLLRITGRSTDIFQRVVFQ